MLSHLRVVNLGVLEDASVDPSPEFTVITGETGAGKTLLLGGLRLALGAKPDSVAVGPYGEEARVDAMFDHEATEVGVSRVVPRDGRSRAYLDGTIASAATVEEKVGPHIEIVGQHDQLSITRPARLLDMIDAALDDPGRRTKDEYVRAWAVYREARERQHRLGGDQLELARELDLSRHQAAEISGARLRPGLDRELEASVTRLRHLEEIRDHLGVTLDLAETMKESSGEIVSRLRKTADLDAELGPLSGEAEGMAAVVDEIARSARGALEGLDADRDALDDLEERLTAIGELKRKYGRTMEEVIAFGTRMGERVEELESLIDEAEHIDDLVARAADEVSAQGAALSEARRRVATTVAGEVLTHLGDLGLERARIEIDVVAAEPGPGGADRVEMRFASDDRLEPAPVGSVASGGELSRLVLAIRLATHAETTETLVFDEVDTGIGGRTARAMGEKLADLSRSSQVLCVTHLPQVAAHADRHYVVERGEDGVARVRLVDGEERLVEISRMLAGLPESEAGRVAAAELLTSAAK